MRVADSIFCRLLEEDLLRKLCVSLAFLLSAASLSGQIIEPNVNMVAGTDWPHGDPFLQRQNEPTMAVSTRNPLHLLGGANDYRTVDVPFDTPASPDNEERGDAWLGVFKSRNGGQTWWSDLLPGYPQDAGSTSPLHTYQAAADAVVRSGPNGMFYFSGLVLNRDANPASGVFVARFIDGNFTENGDPFTYLGVQMIDKGNSGQFLDKPWVAVGPGTLGAKCTVSGQIIDAQNVYIAYTVFVGNDNNIRTKLMFARSTDCGATWSAPQKLNEGYPVNQGASIVVSPTGPVYVVWRQFKSNSDPDAIVIARSTNQGQTFTKGAIARTITPFEQGMTPTAIRTNAYPTAAADSLGRLYIAWSDRGASTDGRLQVISSSDGGTTWTSQGAVDSPAFRDDEPATVARGHQFMPAMSISGDKLVLIYYDLRDDHRRSIYTKNGNTLVESLQWAGDSPQNVFLAFLMDSVTQGLQPLTRRHTLDLRAVSASVAAPVQTLAFSAPVRVSRYIFGSRPNANGIGYQSLIEQLQFSPPNYPMFRLGTAPFIGDYIDVAGYGAKNSKVFHATWTDNRDVRPPADGVSWAKYTPPVSLSNTGTSKFTGGIVPQCIANQPNFASTRNQNIYTTRLTDGVFAGSPGNAKQLGVIPRAFVVFVQNTTKTTKSFDLTITNQPPAPGYASFDQFNPAVTTLANVQVSARSTVTRTVFVSANAPKSPVNVDITESLGGPLSTSVAINPDVSNPDVSNPDVSNPDVSNPDVSNPDVSNSVINAEVHNPDVSNVGTSTFGLQNPDVSNPDVSNPDVSNPDVSNPDVSNIGVGSPDVSNPDVSNPDVSNPDVSNTPVSDTSFTVTNKGNTSSGYKVNVVSNTPIPDGAKVQLIVHRLYQTPVAQVDAQGNPTCQLGKATRSQLLVNVPKPVINVLGQPDQPDPNPATLWLVPGDGARITLRVYYTQNGVSFDPGSSLAPVVTAEANNVKLVNGQVVVDPAPASALPLFLTTTAADDAVVGKPYTMQFAATGGDPPYTWSVSPGSINANGLFSNTFASAGTSSIVVTVTDAAAKSVTKTYQVSVYPPLQITTASISNGAVNVPYTTTTLAATGGKTAYTWSLSNSALPAGLTLNPNSGAISGTPAAVFSGPVTFKVIDAANPQQSATKTFQVTIIPTFSALVHLIYDGQPVTPTTPPDTFAENLDSSQFMDPSQIVWNNNDTVTVKGLLAGNYVVEVASRENAAQKYLPGGFFGQANFAIGVADASVTLTEQRLLHVNAPVDNATILSGSPCQPGPWTTTNQLTWQPIEVANAVYRYQVIKWKCDGTFVVIAESDGTTTSTSINLGNLGTTAGDEYYTVTVNAFASDGTTPIGRVMSVGSNWYGWDVRFTVPTAAPIFPSAENLAPANAGSFVQGQSYSETRVAEIAVQGNGPIGVSSMTLKGVNLNSPGVVGARIYNVNWQLVASADANVGAGANQTVTVPIAANLDAGGTYRVGFSVSAGSGTFLQPTGWTLNSTPSYMSTSGGWFQITRAWDFGAAPTNPSPNVFVPQVTIN